VNNHDLAAETNVTIQANSNSNNSNSINIIANDNNINNDNYNNDDIFKENEIQPKYVCIYTLAKILF
jgi:hypothetical protein